MIKIRAVDFFGLNVFLSFSIVLVASFCIVENTKIDAVVKNGALKFEFRSFRLNFSMTSFCFRLNWRSFEIKCCEAPLRPCVKINNLKKGNYCATCI